MAKYIDLLREHQKKGEKTEEPSATSLSEESAEEQHEEDELALSDSAFPNSDLLADDTINPYVERKDKTIPNSELLADDTMKVLVQKAAHQPATPPSAVKSNTTGSKKVSNDKVSEWLTICARRVAKLFSAARSDNVISIEPLSAHLNVLLKKADENESHIVDALELEISKKIKRIGKLDADLSSLIRKSIMMMLYAIKMGQRLKLNRDEVLSHTLAAMIHHIGMAQIPSEIRNKKERLTKKELNEIRTAPVKSFEYLNRCNISDATILDAASQAQERYDGSGPQGLEESDIAYSARMISPLSMFEALIHYRPYRSRLLPRDAIRDLVNNHKKEFDPIMLKALIESISLYPVGTYVQLNSGDVGLVTLIHPRLPLRPLVLVTHDSQGGKVPPREIDLQNQPNLMVKRCMYEENLSELKEKHEKDAR